MQNALLDMCTTYVLIFNLLCILVFVQELESRETVLLVDRYKYLDLYPCSKTELTVLGYEVICIYNCCSDHTTLFEVVYSATAIS